MSTRTDREALMKRRAPLEMEPDEFREVGHRLVDEIAAQLSTLKKRPVTPAPSLAEVQQALGAEDPLPETGTAAGPLLSRAVDLLFEHSLFNGHPRFFGYITSSAAPIGAFGDFLAAAVNPNVGSWQLSPMATEIEAQSVRWIAQLIGFPPACGGLLVSGGNMANFVCFLTARAAKATWDIRQKGLADDSARRLRVYASQETHTWIQKAADLFGLGTDAIRWVEVDKRQRMDVAALRHQIEDDRSHGDLPFLVVGTAGSVSTGAVDPLPEIAAICREYDLWFHVDGAYGALAAQVPGGSADLQGLSEADSVAVDPHKWLYAPLEAGCALVRHPRRLRDAFSYHPPYYQFDEQATNYFDLGLQNSRGFRALKVWLALRQAGRSGYMRMIADDIRLAQQLYNLVAQHSSLEPLTQSLSITTFRYVPSDLRPKLGSEKIEAYLNSLNQALLARIETSGQAFLSNAVVAGRFALRACVVNFRTSLEDIEALPELIAGFGQKSDAELRGEDDAGE